MGLDDLLSYDDEAAGPARPRRRPLARRVLGTVAGCMIVAFVLLSFLHSLRFTAPYLLIVAALLTASVLYALVQRVGARPLPDTMKAGPATHALPHADEDGLEAAVRHWELRLDWTGRDGQRFAAATQPAIIEIIDDRLRVRHGVDRRADPKQARELLGPRLWTFVTEPARRRMTGRELSALAAEMEEL